MPAKGWRKPVPKPIDGETFEKFEKWLADGGYDLMVSLLKREFGKDTDAARALVHETIESLMSPVSWRKYDPAKGPIDKLVRKALWLKLIRYRRDHYNKAPMFSLTDTEGFIKDVADDSHKMVGVRADLEKAVESLSEPYQRVFLLIAKEGYTVEEVAELTDSAVVSIEELYEGARRQLQTKLAAYGRTGSQPAPDSKSSDSPRRLAA